MDHRGQTTRARNRLSRFVAPLWLTCFLIAGGWLLAKSNVASPLPEASTAQAAASVVESPTIPTRPIETLRVGQRLPARNPDLPESARSSKTQVDPATWRMLKLRAEYRQQDGTLDVHNIETLQPLTWITAHNAEVGASVPIPVDLVEIGSPSDLRATVIAVEPCPPIEDGPGQVILTTVNHPSDFLFRLTVSDDRGLRKTIGVTGYHKFYSDTRRS